MRRGRSRTVLKMPLIKREPLTMNIQTKPLITAALIVGTLLCSGCAVIAVADAVVTAGATVVKTGFKVTGAVIDAVIPDSKDVKK